MKTIIGIIALVGILLQTFNQVVIVGQYYANRDFIAKNLCENRDKPMMHCNGKCCLKKKLAQQGKDQLPNSQNQKNEQVVNLFYSDNRIEIKHFVPLKALNKFFSYNDLATASFHGSVFHPPTV